MSEVNQNKFEAALKMISPLLAIAAFLWGVYTYGDSAQKQRRQAEIEAKRTAETRRIEATRPFLDKQLALYTEATRIASVIATSSDKGEINRATKRFKELYWGELGLVERDEVARAMVDFQAALDRGDGQADLGGLALKLAHACREELAVSWGTNAWKRSNEIEFER